MLIYCLDFIMVNYYKYSKQLHSQFDDQPLEVRGPTIFPSVFTKYNFSVRRIKNIKLEASSRSKGTQLLHNRVLIRFENFCNMQNRNLLNFSSKTLENYITQLEDSRAKLSHITGLCGSIEFLVAATKIKNPWSKSVSRMYEGLIRRAASEKSFTKKAPVLKLTSLLGLIDKYISPFVDNPDKVKFNIFFFFILIYFSLFLILMFQTKFSFH